MDSKGSPSKAADEGAKTKAGQSTDSSGKSHRTPRKTATLEGRNPAEGTRRTEQELEACMKASEDELRHVASSVHRSFAQSGSISPAPMPSRRPALPRPSVRHRSTEDRSMRSSRSSGVMEQLMAEMDQVFHSVLEGEDELRIARRSMTTASDTSSYSNNDDLGLASLNAESCHWHAGNEDKIKDLDLLVRQPETPRWSLSQDVSEDTLTASAVDIRQRLQHVEPDIQVKPGTSKESVPLAEMDKFSESTGPSSDEGAQHMSGWPSGLSLSGCDTTDNRLVGAGDWASMTGDDADLSSPMTASSGAKISSRKRKHGNQKHKSGRTVMNGPVATEQHIVDMNGNGTSKYRRWLSRIESYDDLERTFAGDPSHSEDSDVNQSYSMIEFAEKYYNTHYISFSGYSGALTKTVNMVRHKSLSEAVSVEDLLKYTKNSSIPTSHVHLLDTEDVSLACSIFKDLYKYVRAEIKGEGSHCVIRGILVQGLDRIALRDELYCQLVRLTNSNPSLEGSLRAWSAMCLCTVSFSPSRTLTKYLVSYLRQCCDVPCEDLSGEATLTSKVSAYAEYCLEHIRVLQDRPRKRIPSNAEIELVTNLKPLYIRIYFLDGTTKTIAFSPTDSAQDVLYIIKDKIGLKEATGWALYESTPTHDRYIREHEYIADILADWEEHQSRRWRFPIFKKLRKQKQQHSNPSTPKKGSPRPHEPPYGKLIMCKRTCQRVSDISDDPVEIHLLYIQALHYVVHLDEYSAPPNISLHLAGLQSQVEFGEYNEEKLYRYEVEDAFLSQRVLCSDSRHWKADIAAAHKRFGKGKSALEAELRYITIVSQFQLYACTKIFAHYRGVWPYGIETILAVNYDGIKCISLQEKTLVFDYYYADIEQILLEERYEECHIILQLKNCVSQSRQKCYMFECLGLEDFASLIECYSPNHATWTKSSRSWRRKKFKPTNDWLKLYEDILLCRRTLLQSGLINKPNTNSGGIFKAALNKLSGRNCTVGRHDDLSDDCGVSPFWSFSRTPFKGALTMFSSHEMNDVSARMFNSTLVYTGLESAVLDDMDLVVVVQTLIKKCMDNDDLCNEFYLQLIKQTTDTQAEINQKAVLRYWYLMTLATCVMLPPNEVIFNYLNLHLRRYAMQQHSEEGQYAYFCIKSLYRTYEKKGRRNPPSYKEIHFVTNREPIEARVYLSDGHAMLIEFDSATTAEELIRVIKAKAGMRLEAEHYGVYQTVSDREIYLKPEEKLADALFTWERTCKNENPLSRDLNIIFKKRLFIDPFVNLHDPMEIDLLYNQSVTDVFEQKIPMTKSDATALCGLRAQFEYGDYGQANSFDYNAVMRILPRHLRDLLLVEEITLIHKSFAGMTQIQANIAFLEILKQWPLYGATIYDVTQTTVDSLPRVLWLAVSQMGIHMMEVRGPNIFFTYTFGEISSCSSTSKNISIKIGKESEGPGYLFYTSEGDQISDLIQNYGESLAQRRENKSKNLAAAEVEFIGDDSDSVNIDSLTLDLTS